MSSARDQLCSSAFRSCWGNENRRDISESATEQRTQTSPPLASVGLSPPVTQDHFTTNRAPASHLHMFLGEEPRPVGQDFVDLPERLQLPRGFVQAV